MRQEHFIVRHEAEWQAFEQWLDARGARPRRARAASADPERAYVEQVMPIKQRYYLDYVAQRSLAGDLRMLWDTARALVQ